MVWYITPLDRGPARAGARPRQVLTLPLDVTKKRMQARARTYTRAHTGCSRARTRTRPRTPRWERCAAGTVRLGSEPRAASCRLGSGQRLRSESLRPERLRSGRLGPKVSKLGSESASCDESLGATRIGASGCQSPARIRITVRIRIS